MKVIPIPLSESSTQSALLRFKPYITQKTFSEKLQPFVFDPKMAGIQSMILLLDYLHIHLKKNVSWSFNAQFMDHLKSFQKMSGLKFYEYIDKAITVLILSKLIKGIVEIEDEPLFGNKILDLKIYRKEEVSLLELSSITLDFYLQELQKIETNHFNLKFNKLPIYYEVVFEELPNETLLKKIVKRLLEAVKNKRMPSTLRMDNCELYIDFAENRKSLPQIPRDSLNGMNYLKAFRMNGPENYMSTLAIKFTYKTVLKKIKEEIKQHGLEKERGTIISLHIPYEMLRELSTGKSKMNEIVKSLQEYTYIKNLLLFSLRKGSILDISYIFKQI